MLLHALKFADCSSRIKNILKKKEKKRKKFLSFHHRSKKFSSCSMEICRKAPTSNRDIRLKIKKKIIICGKNLSVIYLYKNKYVDQN